MRTQDDLERNVSTITEYQRGVLVEHAFESTHLDLPGAAESRFGDVVADLAMGRPVADRDLLVEFLWHRLTIALDAGASRKAHWVWSVAVQVLDLLDEDLGAIFDGRPSHANVRSYGSL
jgi:hypothetical protein